MAVRRLFLGVLAAVLLLGGGLAGVPVHAASPYGSVTGISGVLYDDCRAYPYQYSVDVPPASTYRAVTVTVVGPAGAVAARDYVTPATDQETGTSTVTLCRPTDPYGTYTIRAVVEWGEAGNPPFSSAPLDDAHFTMRKPSSRTSVSASTRRPAYGQVVAYRFRSLVEEPTGHAGNAFAWVHLEKRVGGRWVRVKGGRAMTHSTGAVTVRLRYLAHHHRTWLRAVTEPSPRYARSVSAPLRLW